MNDTIRLIDYIENESLIEKTILNYHIDDDLNIVSDCRVFMNIDLYFSEFNNVIYMDKLTSYNRITKLLSFAKINGHDDWRIPTESELLIILNTLYDNNYGSFLSDSLMDGKLKYDLMNVDFLVHNDSDYGMTIGVGLNKNYKKESDEAKFMETAYDKDDQFCHFLIVR